MEGHSEKGKRDSPEDVYRMVVGSYALGIERLTRARIAALTAQLALARVHAPGFPQGGDDTQGKVIADLQTVSYGEFDAFTYVQSISYLVYATSLLDCFLTETTRFLFLRFPGAMGKKQSITVDAILAAESREDLLVEAASRKVKELGYLSFLDRIEFLSTQFGLPITLDVTTVTALAHYSNMRNVIIHDQNVFETVLAPGGVLEGRRKTCVQHPTPVLSDDLQKATAAYHAVVKSVYSAVFVHVFKTSPDESFAPVFLVGLPTDEQRDARKTTPASTVDTTAKLPNKPLQPTSDGEQQ